MNNFLFGKFSKNLSCFFNNLLSCIRLKLQHNNMIHNSLLYYIFLKMLLEIFYFYFINRYFMLVCT